MTRRSPSLGELDRIVRERSYLRPLPAVPALHQMARARLADVMRERPEPPEPQPRPGRTPPAKERQP